MDSYIYLFYLGWKIIPCKKNYDEKKEQREIKVNLKSSSAGKIEVIA